MFMFASVTKETKRTNIMEEILSFLQSLLHGGMEGVQMAISPVIAAAAIGVGSSILNGIFGSSSAKKQKEEQLKALQRQREDNQAWRKRHYNEDATQTASAQLMMRRANEAIKKRTQAALGKKNVIGGTDASMAATQQANAEAIGDALGDIVAKAEARKDDIDQQYRETDRRIAGQMSDVNSSYEAAKRQNLANAATGAVKSMASVVAANSGTDGSGTDGSGTDGSGTDGSGTDGSGALPRSIEAGRIADAGNAIEKFKPTAAALQKSMTQDYDKDPWQFAHRES